MDSQANTSDEATAANKALVLDAVRWVFVDRDTAAVDRFFSETYIQHNPTVPDGREAFRQLVVQVASNPAFRYEVTRAVAEGALVAVHSRISGFGPEPLIAFDIFRVKDGRIVEHWDALQPEVTETASGHTMLDGPTEIEDRGQTAANKARVKSFVETVLLTGAFDRATEFVHPNHYIQHNPQAGDGLGNVFALTEKLTRQGIGFNHTRLHRLIAEGNFVLSVSEGAFAGRPTAYYDLFRLENGQIVEHWDVIQPIPDHAANSNGMF